MIIEWLQEQGHWAWLIVGLLLLVGEVVVPGILLIWFGLAAVTVGLLGILPFSVVWWPWQMQFVAFGVLSLIYVIIGTRLFPSRGRKGDAAASINDPLSRHIGKDCLLIEPIESGTGRIKLGDTTWRVTGPALDAGHRVRIVAVNDGVLQVEPLG